DPVGAVHTDDEGRAWTCGLLLLVGHRQDTDHQVVGGQEGQVRSDLLDRRLRSDDQGPREVPPQQRHGRVLDIGIPLGERGGHIRDDSGTVVAEDGDCQQCHGSEPYCARAARLSAIPSRMSCSLTMTSSNPPRVRIRSSTSAPPPMTSTLPGCMTGSAARCARVAASICAVTSWTSRAGIRDPWIRAESYSGSPIANAATVVTEPARPTMRSAVSKPVTAIACDTAASMSVVAASISAGVGGSVRRWRSVIRTHPTFSLTLAPTRESPTTNSVEPPPMSTTATRPGTSSTETAPAKLRAASSSPEMTSGTSPSRARTPSTNTSALSASLDAEVATIRTACAPAARICAA